MQGTVHLLAGAAIGVLIPHAPTMIPLALLSHYILDLLPHIDPETFAHANKPYTLLQRISLTADIIIVLGLVYALFLLQNSSIHIFLAAITAMLPDLLVPLEKYSIFHPLRRFHYMFHWNPNRAKYWDWYIAGLIAPVIVGTLSVFIIWRF